MRLDRLINLRESKNLNMKQAAAALDVSARSYSYYEAGERNPDYDTLKRMAIFFDTSVDYLLGLTDIKKPYRRNS